MFRGIVGRITAQQIESRVKNVLHVWTDWSVFPPLYIVGLESSFLMSEGEHVRLNRFVHYEICLHVLDYLDE